MLTYNGGSFDPKPIKYSVYKADKFKTKKDEIKRILSGINYTSLKPADKKLLIKEIKKIVKNF